MPYAINQGIRIHYQIEGDGPPLVLQHGLFWRVAGWYRYGYVDALKDNHRLILIDARGHGASDKPHEGAAYTLPQHVGDITAVLDAQDIPWAHFWGYSMGGWFGFGMAKYAPERHGALIIGGAHPYAGKMPPASRPDGSDPEAFLDAFVSRAGIDRAVFTAEQQAEILDNDFLALAARLQDRPDIGDVLPSITKPSFLYVGEADGNLPGVQDCVQQIPDATLVTIPGLTHPETFYRADLVLPHVLEFLQSLHRD
jgi:pimeloyl-ACP methyl ester carboxylesterase